MTQNEIVDSAKQAWKESGEGWVDPHWFDSRAKCFEHFAKLVAAKEREDCAKLIEHYPHWVGKTAKTEISNAIRARGAT